MSIYDFIELKDETFDREKKNENCVQMEGAATEGWQRDVLSRAFASQLSPFFAWVR